MTVDSEAVIAARRRAYFERRAERRRRYKAYQLPPDLKVARLVVPATHPLGVRQLLQDLCALPAADRGWFLAKAKEIIREYERAHGRKRGDNP